jgi:hypothetical protein
MTGQVVNEGDIQLTPLSIAEFTMEPGSMSWRDSRYVLVCKAMTPTQAQEHYQLDFTPEDDGSSAMGPFQRRLWNAKSPHAKLTLVYTYYERPGSNSDGRHLVVVNGKSIVDEPWPFPFKELPIYVYRQQKMAKKWTGHTFMDDVRPQQVLYNALKSVVFEHAKLAGNARLAVPDNAGISADDLTDTPGEIVFYDGMSSKPPMYIAPAQVPRWMMQMIEETSRTIDDLMSVHDISRGQAPGDRNSGLALSVLAEKDETPMGVMARDQSDGWGEIGTLCLKMWESKVVEFRQTTTTNAKAGVPVTREWRGSQLKGQTRLPPRPGF